MQVGKKQKEQLACKKILQQCNNYQKFTVIEAGLICRVTTKELAGLTEIKACRF